MIDAKIQFEKAFDFNTDDKALIDLVRKKNPTPEEKEKLNDLLEGVRAEVNKLLNPNLNSIIL